MIAEAGYLLLRDALAARLGDEVDPLMAWVAAWVRAGHTVDEALAAYPFHNLAHLAREPQVQDALAHAYAVGGQTAAVEAGVTWGLREVNARRYAADRAAEMVGRRRRDGALVPNPNPAWAVTDATRARVRDLVVGMLDDGASYRDLAARVRALPAFPGLFGEYRAEMIARTELAMASNTGAVDLYAEHGLTHLYVIDNPECPACAPVAGTVQTIAWCRQNPTGHPHCIRSFRAPTAFEQAAMGGREAIP